MALPIIPPVLAALAKKLGLMAASKFLDRKIFGKKPAIDDRELRELLELLADLEAQLADAKKQHDIDQASLAAAKKQHDIDQASLAAAEKQHDIDQASLAAAEKQHDIDQASLAAAEKQHDIDRASLAAAERKQFVGFGLFVATLVALVVVLVF